MTRRLIGVAVVATSAAALVTAGPAVAVSIVLLAALLREHALRTGAERRLLVALGTAEDAMAEIKRAVPAAVERGMATAGRNYLARLAAGTDDEDDGAPQRDRRTLH